MEGKIRRPIVHLTRLQGGQIVNRRWRGETYPSLAREFGVSVETVRRVVSGEYRGWWKPPKPPRTVPRRPGGRVRGGRLLTDDQVREIRQLRGAGWTLPSIGIKFQISDSSVSRIANGLMYADVG